MNEYPDKKLTKVWIQGGITDHTITWAKSFGHFLQSTKNQSQPLTSSQIRRFFGELKRIQADPEKHKNDIPLLKAKLAYAVGRDVDTNRRRNKTKIKELYEELEKGIEYIRKDSEHLKQDLLNFVKIVESVVAYHKYFGGK